MSGNKWNILEHSGALFPLPVHGGTLPLPCFLSRPHSLKAPLQPMPVTPMSGSSQHVSLSEGLSSVLLSVSSSRMHAHLSGGCGPQRVVKGLATVGAQDILRDKRVSLDSSPVHDSEGWLPGMPPSPQVTLRLPQVCEAGVLPGLKDPELEGLAGEWKGLPSCLELVPRDKWPAKARPLGPHILRTDPKMGARCLPQGSQAAELP